MGTIDAHAAALKASLQIALPPYRRSASARQKSDAGAIVRAIGLPISRAGQSTLVRKLR